MRVMPTHSPAGPSATSWSGTAVVTGGASGLGAAMVDRFAAAGMPVVVLDIDGNRAEVQAARVREAGGRALGRQVDVSDRTALAEAARATAEFGGCSILCCNVGVMQFGAVDRLTAEEWRWVMDVNVLGTVHTVDAFLPLLRNASGTRRIVLTSSSGALVPGVRMAAYVASKHAVLGYGEVLREELAGEGIGVSVLFPAGMTSRHLESTALARPTALGPAEVRADDVAAMMASRGVDAATHVATPEHATRHLLADLAADERYIVTHGRYREALASRLEALLAAVDRGPLE
jgi:NAD(P)-dependent dehydrogenase (short-subunit alcohol dehydrogenase family)